MNVFIVSPNLVWGGAATANMAIAQMLSKNHCVYYNDEYNEVSMDKVVYDAYPTHQTKDSKKLVEHLLSLNIDFVIWGISMNIPYFRKATRILHKKGVGQCVLFHSLAIVKNLKGRLMEKLTSMSLEYIDHLVFVSKYTDTSWSGKYRVIRNHPNHHVIYNPINISNEIACKQSCHRIGFVGRFSEEKQPELFAKLSVSDDSNSYIAWGDGPLRCDLIAKYPKVDFRGLSSNQDEIYSSIDILVMTSTFENCPMVILEAWNHGIPCVVPNVGGIPEVVIDKVSGRLYEGYSLDTISSCIREIQKNYAIYSNACLEAVQKFSFDKIYEQWSVLLG